MSILLGLMDYQRPGAGLSFNGPMLGLPYSLTRLGFTYTRNSPKTVYQGGAVVTLAANQFGTTFDHLTDLYGYLPEPAGTNLVTNSAGAASTWTCTNTADAVTPITGFSNSIQFGDNSVIRAAYKSASVTSGTVYTVSAFVQMDDGLAPVVGVNTSTGDMTIRSESTVHTNAALVTYIGNSIYRVSSSRTAGATVSAPCGIAKSTTQSARTFRVIGLQVETGGRPSSYIATTGSTASRAADVLTTPVTNIPGFTSSGYTILTDTRFDIPYSLATSGRRCSVDDGTLNNAASITTGNAATQALACVSGGVTVASIPMAVGIARTKFAASYSANNFLVSADGVAGTADTSGAMPVSPTHYRIGCRYDNATQSCQFIYGIWLFPFPMTQTLLDNLTR